MRIKGIVYLETISIKWPKFSIKTLLFSNQTKIIARKTISESVYFFKLINIQLPNIRDWKGE